MTVFLRVLDEPVDDKAFALRRAVLVLRTTDGAAINLEPTAFSAVPGSPFAYWVSEKIRAVFQRFEKFEARGRSVRQGLATADNFRFLRAWWEVDPDELGASWFPFAKGGSFSPFYADIPLVLEWRNAGAVLKAKVIAEYGNVGKRIYNEEFYFRAGLTWPLRTQSGFGLRAMPQDCVFGHKGPGCFVAGDDSRDLLALLGAGMSTTFRYLVELQTAFGAYEVGVIQRTPVPLLIGSSKTELAKLARRVWSLKRSLDTLNETSHAFLLPLRLNERVTGLDQVNLEHELELTHRQVDDTAFSVYDIGVEDRAIIEASFKRGISRMAGPEVDEDDVDSSSEDETSVDTETNALYSWFVGVAFGRFDPRLATGERPIPPEPEPFDPLPPRSPGMYPEGEEPANRPDILVDDEGHADDLAARAIAVAERVHVDTPENLRTWLAKEFFALHIKMYSKSRRKAPIYWQLATASASYSVWLYIHAFSKDTLFRVQNDYAVPKLAHEERRLESLIRERRDGATAAQRKELAAQETFVEELRAFLDEVKRVAPLWDPDLDDGVIINFAPLWRLVPQNKSWQKELKSTWDALCEGKYDWAHLAMHLWPERVVPDCAKDRSLAIAHGLEEVFWVEGANGKWTARETPTRSVDELVRERTKPAVKAALKSLLEAPSAAGVGKKPRKGKSRA